MVSELKIKLKIYFARKSPQNKHSLLIMKFQILPSFALKIFRIKFGLHFAILFVHLAILKLLYQILYLL